MRWRISMSLSGKPWRRKCRQPVLINGTLLRYVHRLERDAVARAHVQDFGTGELG